MGKLIWHNLLIVVMLLAQVNLMDEFMREDAPVNECIEGNCLDGFGRGYISNGHVYEGKWHDGEPHGEGKMYNFSTGKSVMVYFEYGELMEEQKIKP